MNPQADFYFIQEGKWHKEISLLRSLALDCGLTETVKWGCPCYTWQNANIVLIHTFKEYCGLLFFKGALLSDKKRLLVQQTERVQSARQARFTKAGDITSQAQHIKACILEAIEVEKAGLKVTLKNTSAYPVAEEFARQLKKMPALKKAFAALTPGRQRGYLLYFSAPKQSSTRQSRIDKSMDRILAGKGLNDPKG